MKIEHEAMVQVIGDLVKKDEFISLLFEFDARKTREAIFAYHCDKLEADLQAKVYQDMGCYHSLDDQNNNVVFKSAKAAFDIWYECDKGIYSDDEVFAQMLDYAKTHDTQKSDIF